jgi:hypothetical protein
MTASDSKIICIACRAKIDRRDSPPGYNTAAACLRHFVRRHGDLVVAVDRHQLALQDPHVELDLS